jgi:hypothetical protein
MGHVERSMYHGYAVVAETYSDASFAAPLLHTKVVCLIAVQSHGFEPVTGASATAGIAKGHLRKRFLVHVERSQRENESS